MNAQDKKTKSRAYTGIIVALVFLFNPNISVIDILPDFVAYFILARTFLLASDCAPYFEEARVAFKRLGWLSFGKIFGLALMFIVKRGNSADNDIVTLITLVFAICEVILTFSAIKNLFAAFFYLGNRTNAEATISPFEFMGRKMRPETVRDISFFFFALKCIVYFAPTPFLLTNLDTPGAARMKWFVIILLLSQVICVIAGVLWLCIMRKYALSIVNEGKFNSALDELLENNKGFSLPKKQMLRTVISTLTLFEIAAFFTIELALIENYDVNIIPHFIYASLLLYAAYKLSSYADNTKPLLISGIVYIASTVIFYFVQSYFLTEYGYARLVTNKDARSFYPTVTALAVVEFLCLIAFLFFVYRMLLTFIKKHTGINEDSASLESNDSYYGTLMKKNLYFFISGVAAGFIKLISVILHGAVKLVYSDNGSELKNAVVSPAVEWIGLAVAIAACVYIGVTLYFISTLKDEVKMKYEDETVTL